MLKLRTRASTLFYNRYISTPNPNHLLLLYLPQRNPPLSSFLRRNFSGKSKVNSFIVSYLINSCGLSPESALSVSEKVYFETTERPDSVINFLKLHGFSQTHISKLVKKLPSLLLSNCEKTLLPKFEFFMANGVSSIALPSMTSGYPNILERSLKNTIIPNFERLKKVLKSEERAVRAIKRYPGLIYVNVHSSVEPNIRILRDNGVSEENVTRLLQSTPKLFIFTSDMFKSLVDDVKEMGFDLTKTQFAKAMSVKAFTRKSMWEKKSNAFMKWGWSEDVILEAFQRDPWCFMVSEKKITVIMDFLVTDMGLNSLLIAKHPLLLSLSLEKRLKPRAAVFQYLSSNGLIEGDAVAMLIYMWRCPHGKFLDKFVNCYEEAPQLLKLYNEKLNALLYPLSGVNEVLKKGDKS